MWQKRFPILPEARISWRLWVKLKLIDSLGQDIDSLIVDSASGSRAGQASLNREQMRDPEAESSAAAVTVSRLSHTVSQTGSLTDCD